VARELVHYVHGHSAVRESAQEIAARTLGDVVLNRRAEESSRKRYDALRARGAAEDAPALSTLTRVGRPRSLGDHLGGRVRPVARLSGPC
jgi:hypothetical protein